jgi:hypothetical protein
VTVALRPCWICGNPADSREHKFKRSDLAQSSKSWAPDDQPYYVGEGGWRRIQGPGSVLVKFEKVLCHACNTTRTQPFDRAYERFAQWVNQKGDSLMAETQIDFAEVYGADSQSETANLVRYFAKHLGCRIASENYTMPPGLVSSLTVADPRPFEVTLSRNSEVAGYPLRGPGTLHNFPTLGLYSPTRDEAHGSFISGMIVGHLDVIYRYDYPERYAWEGDAIQRSRQTARLGEYIAGAPHPTNGMIPGTEIMRRITIGGVEYDIPVLSREHIQYLLSLGLPSSDMPVEQNIEARLRIAHAILSPFYPDLTESFLEENLTLADTDKLWSCVFPSRSRVDG